MTLTIAPVQTSADKRAFYRFAHTVYQNDPYWVPHLWPQRKAYLDRRAAFFSYGEGDFWLARRDDRVIGTIGAAIDHTRNRNKMLWEGLPDEDSEVDCVSDLQKHPRWKAKDSQQVMTMESLFLIREGLLNRPENLLYGGRDSSDFGDRYDLAGNKSLYFP